MIFNWFIEQKIERLKQHLARKVEAAIMTSDPFPHVVVNDIFPDWYFGRAQQCLIGPEAAPVSSGMGMMKIEDDDPRFSRLQVEQRSFWRHLDSVVKPAICDALVNRFHPYTAEKLRLLFGQAGPTADPADFQTTRGTIHFSTNEANRRIHLDKATSLFTYLLNFSAETSRNEEGISLYRANESDALIDAYKKRSEVRVWYPSANDYGIELVKTIGYRSNSLVAFLNLPYSLTGVIGSGTGISIKSFCECPPQIQSLFSEWSDATTPGIPYRGNL